MQVHKFLHFISLLITERLFLVLVLSIYVRIVEDITLKRPIDE
jgi:hypothetical protein